MSETDFKITFLGTGSAIPMPNRQNSGQWIEINERHYLVDCGEGTQLQIRKFNLPMQRLSAIFISHLHADHFLGLPGLLSTLDMLDFRKKICLIAPEALFHFLDAYQESMGHRFRFEIEAINLDPIRQSQVVFEDKSCTVTAFALHHSTDCHGFLFEEQGKAPNIRRDAISKFKLEHLEIRQIKSGIIPERLQDLAQPEELLIPPPPTRKYAYVSDTRPLEKWVPMLQGIDLLYHESTFTETWKARAQKTGHSTAAQAARIADLAGVQKLVLGHYSTRYKNLQPFLEEALPIFANTILSEDGLEISISQRN